MKNRKVVLLGLLLACLVCVCIGCGKDKGNSFPENSNQYKDEMNQNAEKEEIYESSKEDTKNYQNSTAKNDTDLGLKNIKLDTAMGDLTDEQKAIIRYFSHDYMFINSIEALQRYNKIFDNARIECYVHVEKVIKYDGDDYELLVNMLETSGDAGLDSYEERTYMIIKGTTKDSRFIQGDILVLEGKYLGVYTKEVDGKSITCPEIDVHYAYLLDDNDGHYFSPSRFTMKEVKSMAKCIFGEDITISLPDADVDPVDSVPPYYVCTLDNQSNAKFSRYYFFERDGYLLDATHENYEIEFSADYNHFFLFMYDWELETLTLEYYDNNLNKIWKREFEDTTNATYDFTKNNVYLCANNSLYIINIETGEDTYERRYIGDKVAIRKFNNGILAISESKSDAFMFLDLEGNILWAQNADDDLYVETVQQVDNNLVIKVTGGGFEERSDYYYVIDMEDGSIVYKGTVDVMEFHMYS